MVLDEERLILLKLKVLLITGTPMRTDTNMGKTLLTLFSDFKKEELCQLYFSPETPNTDRCRSYYQICEAQMVKSFLGIRKSKCGGEVKVSVKGETAICPEKNPLLLTRKKGKIYMRIGREMIWKLTRWKNDTLKKWVEREKPNVIFAIMHDTNGATDAVRWIASRYHIPVVLFITDDYYHDPEDSRNVMRRIYYNTRKKANRKLGTVCKSLVGCSGKAQDYFTRELKIEAGGILYTPSEYAYLALPLKKQNNWDVVKIRYFGNLGLGRFEVLKEIGKKIQKVNSDKMKAILEVYSSVTDQKIMESLTIENGCVFKGWVYGEEYMNLLQDADIVVHAESFEEHNVRRTWASVSTKIADSLGAGKCILAVGPANLASMEHISDVACMVESLDRLDDQLEHLIFDSKYRENLQEKARSLAMREHEIGKIKKKVRSILQSAV